MLQAGLDVGPCNFSNAFSWVTWLCIKDLGREVGRRERACRGEVDRGTTGALLRIDKSDSASNLVKEPDVGDEADVSLSSRASPL
jgi:hypothetical protein